MARCDKCIHGDVCVTVLDTTECKNFKDRSRFMELNIAKKIKHTPDIDKMREFHKLGLGGWDGRTQYLLDLLKLRIVGKFST